MMEDKMTIHWYPGHMTKTRRQIEADLKQVDAICEIVDARIPMSSRNPDIDSICGNKPRVIVLNRMDLADPEATKRWATYFKNKGMTVVCTDCKSRKGIADFGPAVRNACKEKIERDKARGMNRAVRLMVVGIPNVGKSTLIKCVLPDKLERIESGAFSSTALTGALQLPEGLKYVSGFSSTKITSVYFPSTLEEIGEFLKPPLKYMEALDPS